MSFYTITKENGMFTATVRNRFTLFTDENIKDLKQFGIALITTKMDGTHSLYIPTRVCGLTSSVSYIDCEIETIKALSGISSYQYFNDTQLVIADVWKVLYADGEEKILLKCNNDTLSIDLKELMSL